MRNVQQIVQNAVGPFEDYCSSSGTQPTDCYLTAPLIGIGVVPIECSHSGSHLLDHTIAFDRAECSHANMTQTNLIAASSFNGLNGIVWGFDVAQQDLQRNPLLKPETYAHVYDIEPLLDATTALFGTVENKKFPIAPGQHVICAYKSSYHTGPSIIYAALALAIAKDRDRNADLFMEDHGTLVGHHDKAIDPYQEAEVLENLILSVQRIGGNLNVEYEKVFIGLRYGVVGAGEVGCALTAAPYIRLAQRAVPQSKPELLADMSLNEWKDAVCIPEGFINPE